MENSLATQGFKPKTFWERKEGTTGMFVLAGLVVGAGVAGFMALPKILGFLALLLANTALLILAGVTLFVLIYTLTNPKFQKIASYSFQSAMRWLASTYTEIDPIGILKNYVDELKKKKEQFDEGIASLSGQMHSLQREIGNNEKIKEENLKKAEIAQRQNNAANAQLYSREAIRADEANKQYVVIARQMQFLLTTLQQCGTVADYTIQDFEGEIRQQIRKREMIATSYSTMKSAQAIFKNSGEGYELWLQAMDKLEYDFDMKTGEIEDFLRTSQHLLTNFSIETGLAESQAQKMLEDMNQRTAQILQVKNLHQPIFSN